MPPMHAAERGPEIELGEQRRRRPARVDLAMAGERKREQREQIEHDAGEPVFAVAAEQRDRERRHQKRHDLDDEIVREPRPVAEHRHEGQQIERERQHPEQRRGGDVGRDVGGHRDDETGRDGGERDPGEHGRASVGAGGGRACGPGDPVAARRDQRRRSRSAAQGPQSPPTRPRPACATSAATRSRADRRAARRTSRGWRRRRAHKDCAPAGGRSPRTSSAAAARWPTARRTASPIDAANSRDQPEPDAARGRRVEAVRHADRQRRARRRRARRDARAPPARPERAREQMRVGVADQQRA